jgi:multidrug efflux pump subunit AcrA (membrane-fusion protein)
MAETSNGRARPLILWTLAAILLVIVFFLVRRLTREELPLRVAQATMQDLITTDSTNGKVEPQHNFEAHAPAPGTVKSLYVHAGELVPKGKLLLSLDDADAVAHSVGALASLRGAQANYQATEQGGTQEERYLLADELAKPPRGLQRPARSRRRNRGWTPPTPLSPPLKRGRPRAIPRPTSPTPWPIWSRLRQPTPRPAL